ncbi:glycosyltransferase family 2 protein [Limnohabitans sp. JirII-31]|uniref:glycosyltransferase family 2 protein n=1 Tax=Limnohabitans sp. JirII-31 TaxID=1977908 RepID=UPI0013044AAC|nr:glycosyltransferase family 2 protein [Limnohabitans sp. JirII-31]
MKDLLSIFIPTYNRWGILEKTLERTLESISGDVRVVVVDNDSNPNGKEKVEAVIAKYPNVDCRIIKNDANLGADGNVLRCFELCKTPYVMVLGDDDYLVSDFLQKIKKFFVSNHDIGFISFQVPRRYAKFVQRDEAFNSPYDMLQVSANWAEMLFVSTSIFKKDLVMLGLEQGQRHQLTCSAHLIALFKGWDAAQQLDPNRSYEFVLASDVIIDSGGHAADHRSYSLMGVLKGLSVVRSVFITEPQASVVRKSIRGATRYIFKPRVLVKDFFYYTLEFGFLQAWRQLCRSRFDLMYLIGLRSFWYRPYLHITVLMVGAWHTVFKK